MFKPMLIRSSTYITSHHTGAGEEDCLRLNVFVPQSLAARLPHTYHNPDERLADADLLPVIVYIHGGGLVEGASAGLPLWDVAGADPVGTGGGPAVVVSFHYRLGGWIGWSAYGLDRKGSRFDRYLHGAHIHA